MAHIQETSISLTQPCHYLGLELLLLMVTHLIRKRSEAASTTHKAEYPFISQLPCNYIVSSLTYQILLLRVSVFINTIFRELQSNSSSFKTHLILSALTSCLLKSVVLSQIYYLLRQSFFIKRIISIINTRKHLVCYEGIVVGLKLFDVSVPNV